MGIGFWGSGFDGWVLVVRGRSVVEFLNSGSSFLGGRVLEGGAYVGRRNVEFLSTN